MLTSHLKRFWSANYETLGISFLLLLVSNFSFPYQCNVTVQKNFQGELQGKSLCEILRCLKLRILCFGELFAPPFDVGICVVLVGDLTRTRPVFTSKL